MDIFMLPWVAPLMQLFNTQSSMQDMDLVALFTGGANGGLAGKDVLILETDPIAKVDITSITNGILESMPIVQCTALADAIDEGKSSSSCHNMHNIWTVKQFTPRVNLSILDVGFGHISMPWRPSGAVDS